MNDIKIDTLIKFLEDLKAKDIKNIQLKGTLLCADLGNYIIASTEPQK